MEKTLREIRERVLNELAEARATSKLEQIRVSVLGKKGELTGLLRGMGKLPPEERPKVGQMVNEVRAALENALEKRAAELKASEKEARLKAEAVDVTLPGPERSAGSLHPMNDGFGHGRAAGDDGAAVRNGVEGRIRLLDQRRTLL